jgi:hypothetical protein
LDICKAYKSPLVIDNFASDLQCWFQVFQLVTVTFRRFAAQHYLVLGHISRDPRKKFISWTAIKVDRAAICGRLPQLSWPSWTVGRPKHQIKHGISEEGHFGRWFQPNIRKYGLSLKMFCFALKLIGKKHLGPDDGPSGGSPLALKFYLYYIYI